MERGTPSEFTTLMVRSGPETASSLRRSGGVDGAWVARGSRAPPKAVPSIGVVGAGVGVAGARGAMAGSVALTEPMAVIAKRAQAKWNDTCPNMVGDFFKSKQPVLEVARSELKIYKKFSSTQRALKID